MSRIHEALKKAEQERAEVSHQLDGAAPVEPAESQAARGQHTWVHGEPTPGPAIPRSEEAPAALSYSALVERCPRRKWTGDSKSLLFQDGRHYGQGTEEFRTLRSRLYQLREKRPLKSVLVTSAVPGEGKSFVAANLAQAIVRQHERRALLIDADLRRSHLHEVLGAPLAPGLTDRLLGEADEFSVLQWGAQENLFFIPGGKTVSNPAETLANGQMKILLERLAPAFDWIILDSPPVLPVSDASLLAGLCDGVLLVVQAAKTPFDVAQKACAEFREKNLVGVVLNGAYSDASYDSYYYHHGKPAKHSGTKR